MKGEIENRDRLIARLGDVLERFARAARARNLDPRALAAGLDGAAREVRWIGTGKLDAPRRRRLDIVAVVRQLAEGKPIRIEAPARLVGAWDRAHIESILGELASNAMKHGCGAPIIVRIGQQGGTMRLVIEDAGIGPLPRRPFRRFVRGKSAVGDGMGVGLWLVAALARQNGGTLRFARAAGGGTQAIVRLRIAADDERPRVRRAQEAPRRRAARAASPREGAR